MCKMMWRTNKANTENVECRALRGRLALGNIVFRYFRENNQGILGCLLIVVCVVNCEWLY